ncbi:hypothetical protein GCK72_025401 [Caenorhabditis remanei]|uniref:Skp1-related protein n=1 Tax=Caenorhabditis remanei TaxID=31234 RepID=E3MJN1_CAERE|nr:hypothetical protein GCK72_025401 [Caenorhabditis remanei]EFP03557.1 CRE-SKR-20 protein [Caenorhabditis remanei]KAF1748934.1 hypothetical protein GCK72_025401 [Caenorhabditis remanei]
MTTTKRFKLISEDGHEFIISKVALRASKFIVDKLAEAGITEENCETMDPILVPFHHVLVKQCVDWLNHHQCDAPKTRKIKYKHFSKWDKKFFKMESGELFALLNASHALGIDELMNMGCAVAAELIRGKNVEEIRKIYGIKSDEEQMEELLANGGEGTSTMTFTVEKY